MSDIDELKKQVDELQREIGMLRRMLVSVMAQDFEVMLFTAQLSARDVQAAELTKENIIARQKIMIERLGYETEDDN